MRQLEVVFLIANMHWMYYLILYRCCEAKFELRMTLRRLEMLQFKFEWLFRGLVVSALDFFIARLSFSNGIWRRRSPFDRRKSFRRKIAFLESVVRRGRRRDLRTSDQMISFCGLGSRNRSISLFCCFYVMFSQLSFCHLSRFEIVVIYLIEIVQQ